MTKNVSLFRPKRPSRFEPRALRTEFAAISYKELCDIEFCPASNDALQALGRMICEHRAT
jgi:hypothetical protein